MPTKWRILKRGSRLLCGCTSFFVFSLTIDALLPRLTLSLLARARRALTTSSSFCSLLSTLEKNLGRRDRGLAFVAGADSVVVVASASCSLSPSTTSSSVCGNTFSASVAVTSTGWLRRWRVRRCFLIVVVVVIGSCSWLILSLLNGLYSSMLSLYC